MDGSRGYCHGKACTAAVTAISAYRSFLHTFSRFRTSVVHAMLSHQCPFAADDAVATGDGSATPVTASATTVAAPITTPTTLPTLAGPPPGSASRAAGTNLAQQAPISHQSPTGDSKAGPHRFFLDLLHLSRTLPTVLSQLHAAERAGGLSPACVAPSRTASEAQRHNWAFTQRAIETRAREDAKWRSHGSNCAWGGDEWVTRCFTGTPHARGGGVRVDTDSG